MTEKQQTNKTKSQEKLHEHKGLFSKLNESIIDDQQQFIKASRTQINKMKKAIDQTQKMVDHKKKMLALKKVMGDSSGFYQDEKQKQEIPVDGDLKRGSQVFMKNCSSCHCLEGLERNQFKGPALGLLFGRRVGSNQNYYYSMSLSNANFLWTARNLYNFMGSTSSLVKTTTCKLFTHPLKDEEDRADLLALFKQYTHELGFNMRMEQTKAKSYQLMQTQIYVAKHAHRDNQKGGSSRKNSFV